jgi:DNA-binding NtrC family response regulator
METQEQKKILVVEDNPDWRSTFTGMLLEAHFDATGVATVEAAHSKLSAEEYALALLDMRLDESDENNVDGLNLAEEIQLHWPQTRVVIVTGFNTPEILKRAMEPREGHPRLVANFVPKSDVDGLIAIIKKEIDS